MRWFSTIRLRVGVTRLLLATTLALAFSTEADDDEDADRALLEAVLEKDMFAFREALDARGDPNAIFGEYDSQWAMCAAARPGRTAFLEELIAHGGNPNLNN